MPTPGAPPHAAKFLPPPFSSETIQSLLSQFGLPPARRIEPFPSDAVYHSIYFLNFPPECKPMLKPAEVVNDDSSGGTTLVPRVSGKHLPRIKTINEIAVMKYVKRHTTIPIPAVVRFHSSEDNALGHEFILLEKVPGLSADRAWGALHSQGKHNLLSQITDYMGQLHALPFYSIGGMDFELANEDEISHGQVVDKTLWQAPDIAIYWPPGESMSTLNIDGPYDCYTDLCAEKVEKVIYAIGRHSSLAWCRDMVPRLQAFVRFLDNHEAVENLGLNDSKIIMAHGELHLGNIMCRPLNGFITGIIDWEFAGPSTAQAQERDHLMAWFEYLCRERGIRVLEDARLNANQQALQEVVQSMQAIVASCPRAQFNPNDAVAIWNRNSAENALIRLGIIDHA